ncbi:VanZ family protein [Terriglobus roseus]|uniref:VanZ like family protein n=1 Tax=Terriglobus roseus TaxID=392734 RepID=A0A1G7F8U8_9BACT|nr:VanZ family protein [Terriglobus roseus]SDE72327.1 VanZ like family protein [Terriglobus roseus]
MSRPVWLGGRQAPDTKTFVSWLVRTWLPVVVMLTAIAIESTHTFSSDNTSGWLQVLYQAIAGRVSPERWHEIHHYIRKTGHFTGYGLLGLAWLRAWLLFWQIPMKHRSESVWRGFAMVMAVVCTTLVASLDELHQSFMADRTGLVSDVWLDTSGAVCFILLSFLLGKLLSSASE